MDFGPEYKHQWYLTNRERILVKAKNYYIANKSACNRRSNLWAKHNPQRCNESARKYRASHKEECRERAARYRQREADKIKNAARVAVTYAVRKGRLIKPDRCSKCDTVAAVEAHHHRGYSKEFALDVIWLCVRCHTDTHQILLNRIPLLSV